MRDGFESYREELKATRLTEGGKRALTESLCRREPAGRPARRTAGGWRRPAMVAAVLAVVLTGTALAETLAGIEVSDPVENGADLNYEYHLTGIQRVSTEELAPTVAEHIAETRSSDDGEIYCIAMPVESTESAEEFLGVDLPDNAVLEQMDASWMGCHVGDHMDLSVHQSDLIETPGVLWLTGNGAEPYCVELSFVYERSWPESNSPMKVDVRATFYTDEYPSSIEEEGKSITITHYEASVVDKLSYRSPSGLQANVVELTRSFEGTAEDETATTMIYYYTAYFAVDNFFYELEVRYDDEDLALETLKEILDAFEHR